MENIFEPMDDKTSLHILVYNQLKELIISGKLKPGERLMEYEIAKNLNISKTPIREAIRELSKEGLVVHESRRKLTVVDFTEKDIREILTLRAELESIAISLSIPRFTPKDYLELEERIEELHQREDQKDFFDVRRIDIERIHSFLVEMSGNSRLIQMWKVLASQMMVLFQAVELKSKNHGYSTKNHRMLTKMMKDGDVDQACKFLKSHILRNLESIIQEFSHNKDNA
ncbi:MAG: GntR family transcriptional regulator [Bacteroidetes bacterium]|nr:GntR family transcriptional regulator [Bacteroidota bacterium]